MAGAPATKRSRSLHVRYLSFPFQPVVLVSAPCTLTGAYASRPVLRSRRGRSVCDWQPRSRRGGISHKVRAIRSHSLPFVAIRHHTAVARDLGFVNRRWKAKPGQKRAPRDPRNPSTRIAQAHEVVVEGRTVWFQAGGER